MKKEIEVAAKWWADQLNTQDKHDNGDVMQSSFANSIANRLPKITDEQRRKFQCALEKEIERHILRFNNNWDESNSMWGSAMRSIGTDYDVDRVIAIAAKFADIGSTGIRFPIKTRMWINPGEVKVACGYRAPIEVIWQASDTK